MSHFSLPIAAIALLAVAAPSPAWAQQRPVSTTRAQVLGQADAAFARSDTNKDGGLTRNEVDASQARTLETARQAIQARLAQEFAKLDTDKNGQLSRSEFAAAAPQVQPATANASAQVMQRVDANKDGRISIEEYRARILAEFNAADVNKDGTVTAEERQRALGARR